MNHDQIRSLVTQKLTSRYWRRPDAEVIVAALLHSGMTVSAFGREFGVCVQRLGRWRKRLVGHGEGDGSGLPATGFHPVHVVVGDAGANQVATFELVVRGGRRIAVHSDFDEQSLARLVRFVERLGC